MWSAWSSRHWAHAWRMTYSIIPLWIKRCCVGKTHCVITVIYIVHQICVIEIVRYIHTYADQLILSMRRNFPAQFFTRIIVLARAPCLRVSRARATLTAYSMHTLQWVTVREVASGDACGQASGVPRGNSSHTPQFTRHSQKTRNLQLLLWHSQKFTSRPQKWRILSGKQDLLSSCPGSTE